MQEKRRTTLRRGPFFNRPTRKELFPRFWTQTTRDSALVSCRRSKHSFIPGIGRNKVSNRFGERVQRQTRRHHGWQGCVGTLLRCCKTRNVGTFSPTAASGSHPPPTIPG